MYNFENKKYDKFSTGSEFDACSIFLSWFDVNGAKKRTRFPLTFWISNSKPPFISENKMKHIILYTYGIPISWNRNSVDDTKPVVII